MPRVLQLIGHLHVPGSLLCLLSQQMGGQGEDPRALGGHVRAQEGEVLAQSLQAGRRSLAVSIRGGRFALKAAWCHIIMTPAQVQITCMAAHPKTSLHMHVLQFL